MRTTAVIPLERGATSANRLPLGMRYVYAEHDPGERARAINDALAQVESEFVLVLPPDAAITPYALAELEMVAWNADAVYPSLAAVDEEYVATRQLTASPFCRNRLLKENYLGPVALVRTEALRACDGWAGSSWETWLRLSANGRFKEAPIAFCALRNPPPEEPAPTIERPPMLAGFYCQGTPSTAYVRCQLPARYLPGYAQMYWPIQKTDEAGRVVFPTHEGAAVFQYPGDMIRSLLVAYMQEQGIRVLVDVDDNYLAMSGDWAKRAGWTHHGAGPHSAERHRTIAGEADGVIVTTEHLARCYRKVNQNVYVCPNQIDPVDWPEPVKEDGLLRIGWFASLSHRADGALIAPALEWASRQPNVEVVLMGVGASRTELYDEHGELQGIESEVWPEYRQVSFKHIPATNDLSVYRAQIGCLDVGLAPVRRGISADGRSDLKAIEYAAAGALPVLSEVPAYEGWRDGELCRKAATRKDFLRVVKELVANPEQTKQLAREARAHVLAERTVARNAWRWREAIAG